ncbi:MAG TPA: 3-deoxy-7-phosphoheptulonate synthase [Candidatus Methylacidiphilales bacterium]|jgi:3-deoxy-7-phosphoheptulonate synthase|nr:3-deoxy-7-phosphoheptulonate synthase [Candidatus Methylacidiphilales bacterium]
MKLALEDIRIRAIEPLYSPRQIKEALPVSEKIASTVAASRKRITEIIQGNDHRFLAIVGPCSIHDSREGLVYAQRLAQLRTQVEDVMLLVMRVYFEKPRTTVGWKGLVTDPDLNGSDDIARGLKMARTFLLEVGHLGLPAATEFLDPVVPQYLADLVSWAAIGARTTESQTHREMTSGLSMPVGFKNGTDGDFQTALDAMLSARSPHSFLGISPQGLASIIRTQGHSTTHLVLRGGRSGPNCDPATMLDALQKMDKAGLNPALLVDCSHGNSKKQALAQAQVWETILEFHRSTESRVFGAMLESYLETGRQDLLPDKSLLPGLSITDACLGWAETEQLLLKSADKLRG